MDDNGKFDTWAILELMGHRRLAGFLTEEEHCGQSMIRLDVHDADGIVHHRTAPVPGLRSVVEGYAESGIGGPATGGVWRPA